MSQELDDGMTDREVVESVRGFLGSRLTAYISAISETQIIRAWADGALVPPPAVMERLRIAYKTAVVMTRFEDPATVQAWFTGLNPGLSDRSPAQLLRDGGPRVGEELASAVQQFLADG